MDESRNRDWAGRAGRVSRLAAERGSTLRPSWLMRGASGVWEREARGVAALNHPDIAAIYGIEESSADAERVVRALMLRRSRDLPSTLRRPDAAGAETSCVVSAAR